MFVAGPTLSSRPPARWLVQVAGVATQVGSGVCLLAGTIALALVEHTRAVSLGAIGGWLALALAGLVFGGLVYRGSSVRLAIAAAIDGGFGLLLLTFDLGRLRALLQILPASDVDTVVAGLTVAGFAMMGASAVCLAAVPHGVRYARWFRDAAEARIAMATLPGMPPPVPARTMAYVIPDESDPRARRRLYAVLGGLAIGVGAGTGVLVTWNRGVVRAAGDGRPARVAVSEPAPPAARELPAPGRAPAAIDAGAPPPDSRGVDAPAAALDDGPALDTAQALVNAEHDAIAAADRRALADLLAPGVFGVGASADAIAEGSPAVAAQLIRDLGESPDGGFAVESLALSLGQDGSHAWIAELLTITAPGGAPHSLAVSALAARLAGGWRIVALHWAAPVDDATAERLAILRRWPAPAPVADRRDGPVELDQAVRAAFASRAGFADAVSERADAFNLGSGGERVHGGAAIRRLFARLRAQLRMRGGVRTAALGDAAPRVGWAALDVDYTARTRAATEVTQTFRVLAILVEEPAGWKIVQTHWSNGGPVPAP